MASNTLNVGDVTITAVKDIPWTPGNPLVMYPGVVAEQVEPYRHWLNERGHITMSVGSFLVRSAGKTLLIDTGVGKRPHAALRTEEANLLSNLAAHGVRSEDIDLVVNTHLHSDHIGWHTVQQGEAWVPTFPRARYLIQKLDWQYFTNGERGDSPAVLECLLPIQKAGRLDLVDHDQGITPNLTYVPAPGHTPGHVAILVQSRGERALLIGDAAHHPIQLLETGWSVRQDVDPEQAAKTRQALAEWVENEGFPVMGAHFPFPCMGRLVRLQDRRVWQGIELP